jgi:hypothetical protein
VILEPKKTVKVEEEGENIYISIKEEGKKWNKGEDMKMRVISSSMFEDGSNDRADNSNKEGNPEKTTNDYIHNVDEMENETLEDHLKKVEDAYLDLKK